MIPDPRHTNRRAAATIRQHAIDADDHHYPMDVCGLIAPDGGLPEDDRRVYDIAPIESTP